MKTSRRGLIWLRWAARILGSLIVGSWLSVGVLGAMEGVGPLTWESAAVIFFIVTMTVSMLVAWFRERLGGVMLVVVGAAMSLFAYFSAGYNKLLAVGTSGVPLMVVGGLFLAYQAGVSSAAED